MSKFPEHEYLGIPRRNTQYIYYSFLDSPEPETADSSPALVRSVRFRWFDVCVAQTLIVVESGPFIFESMGPCVARVVRGKAPPYSCRTECNLYYS